MSDKQKPSIGRMVHYIHFNGAHLPAIMTHVNTDGKVNVQAFPNDYGQLMFFPNIEEGTEVGTWHWPEREG